MSNIPAYERLSRTKPANNFTLNFDFSKPPLLDLHNPRSVPTPNLSNLSIEGNAPAWGAAITERRQLHS